MTTSASLIERHPGVVDLAIRNREGIQSYRIGAAVSLDTAYAGATTIATVPKGSVTRSKTLRRNRVNWVEESNRGLTRFSYAPADYASTTVPGDTDISFVRITEIDSAGTVLPAGPILVVPPPGFFVAGRVMLNLSGTAPNVAGLANNLPPPTAMRVDFPKFADRIEIFNDGGSSLYVAFGLGTQEIEIPSAKDMRFLEVGASEIFLRGQGGTTAFRLTAALVNGIQG